VDDAADLPQFLALAPPGRALRSFGRVFARDAGHRGGYNQGIQLCIANYAKPEPTFEGARVLAENHLLNLEHVSDVALCFAGRCPSDCSKILAARFLTQKAVLANQGTADFGIFRYCGVGRCPLRRNRQVFKLLKSLTMAILARESEAAITTFFDI